MDPKHPSERPDSADEDCLLKKEIRCRRCNRLLMKGSVRKVEIKCPKCGLVQLL